MSWSDSATIVCIADAFGLAAFAVMGAQKGSEYNLPPLMWVLTAVITSTFGGITRDILCLQQPRVMYPYRTMYATAPLLGGTVYMLMVVMLETSIEHASLVCFAVTLISRIMSFNNHSRLPHWNVSNESSESAQKSNASVANLEGIFTTR